MFEGGETRVFSRRALDFAAYSRPNYARLVLSPDGSRMPALAQQEQHTHNGHSASQSRAEQHRAEESVLGLPILAAVMR